MDWVYLHLIVNHFPIILIIVGAFAGIAGTVRGHAGIRRYGYVTVLLAALTAPVAYVTGRQAEEPVEEEWYVDERQIEEHEELGLIALIGLLIAGATAGAAWWRPVKATNAVFLVAILAATGLTVYTAMEGGKIVHESPVLLGAPPGTTPGGDTPGEDESEWRDR